MAGRTHVDLITDINGVIPELSSYVFTSVSGTATLTGYFVDASGAQVALMETFSVTSGTTLTTLYNAAHSLAPTTPLPTTLLGFEGALSGSAVWYGKSGNADGMFGEAPKSGYPQIQVGTLIQIGRVG